ncbi:hypothetical protein V2J09_001523 [Rumex salicifolius]
MAPLEEAMQKISTTQNGVVDEDETMAHVAQIVDSIAFPMTMQAAIELGLLEIIAGAGPGSRLTAAEVASKLPAAENPQAADMVDRILRLLAAFSVVSCSVSDGDGGEKKRVYGLTPAAKYFVKDDEGVSLGPLLMLLQDKVFLDSWYKLKDAVLEGGIAFNKAHGMNAFEYPGVDSRFNEVFNVAMFNHTSIMMRKILQSYKGFDNINKLVDVGGGLGHNLKIILSKYPNIKGLNFDLPHVTKHGIPHPGMEHMGGDMFEGVPCADAIFMKNCYKAIPENGKVIVVESIVSEAPETTTAAKAFCEMDLIMMTQNPGGKERTKQEFLDLAMAAGFSGIRFECFVASLWVMEFYNWSTASSSSTTNSNRCCSATRTDVHDKVLNAPLLYKLGKQAWPVSLY